MTVSTATDVCGMASRVLCEYDAAKACLGARCTGASYDKERLLFLICDHRDSHIGKWPWPAMLEH